MLFINYILLFSLLSSTPLEAELFISFLISYLSAGGCAYLINDFYDQEVDAKAGKFNLTQQLNPVAVALMVAAGFLLSTFLICRLSIMAGCLLVFQLLLLLLYSHPLLRLKSKPVAGIITDAIYAYLIPALLLLLVFSVELLQPQYIAFLLFNLCVGMRDILLHQLKDKQNDQKAGIDSFAIRYQGKVKKLLALLEITGSLSLGYFLIRTFWKVEEYFLTLPLLLAYIVVLVFQLSKTQQAIRNNYLIRFYILATSCLLGCWLLKGGQPLYILLLLHPYLLQFSAQLKSRISLTFNYSLYYAFKLVGRDLKQKPLLKKIFGHTV
jgi:4-hydroxybenzoate polyprenyltransferase